jgi:Flp pilus assembly pilin Flp
MFWLSPHRPRGEKKSSEKKGGAFHMNEIKNLLSRLNEQRGQTMAEYAVVLAVITVLIITSLTLLSGAISGALDAVTQILP